jgi:peptidoglycan/xylan/chitin deacetylase (PgdA/CDA1 family)
MDPDAAVGMRARLKRLAERVLVDGGAARTLRAARGARTLVLAYHNVVRDGDSVPGMSAHLPLSDFRRQMAILAESARVVPLDRVLEPDPPGRRPRVAVTFDDGYRGASRLAVPVLEELGLPATFFLAPGLLGGDAPWWDALPISGWDEFATVFVELQARDAAVRRWAAERGIRTRTLPPDLQPASVGEAIELAGREGLTVGAHSWSHPNLAAVPAEALDRELAGSRQWIAARFPNAIPWIAYPYGLNSARVRERAAGAGFHAGLTIQGGWFPKNGVDRFALPRLNVPAGLSERGFRLKLSGLFAG